MSDVENRNMRNLATHGRTLRNVRIRKMNAYRVPSQTAMSDNSGVRQNDLQRQDYRLSW
ncbi:MAG: hypothetical protein K2G52_04405 [Muribaculaceae bacterium]|nr:hypothetical protein [Muribaculaceae bacterium]